LPIKEFDLKGIKKFKMTSNKRLATLEAVLDGLMGRYMERVPDVGKIVNAMQGQGLIADRRSIENDHIAFRTLGVKHLGMASLEKIFLYYGYERRDHFTFLEKKLEAHWYHPPQPTLPRIFASELRVGDLSVAAQQILLSYTNEVTADPVDRLDLDDAAQVDAFLHQASWRRPTWADYQALAAESEYAAWVIYNRYYLNHLTISVHNLPPGYNTVASFNEFLAERGFMLNSAGGKIKVSRDGKLLQSSTVAEMVEAEFAGGDRHLIAGSYVEFAERRPIVEGVELTPGGYSREQLRDGFEAANADKIFESTYRAQTGQKS
jgi:hypothetical protein